MDTCIRLVFHHIVKFSKCHVSRDSSRGSDLPKLSEQIKTRITKRCRRRLGLHIAKFPQPVSSTSGSLFISGCVSGILSEFGSPLESAIVICGYLICHLVAWCPRQLSEALPIVHRLAGLGTLMWKYYPFFFTC